MGISYCEPWFDGSLIMVDRIEPPPDTNTVNFANWLKPFDRNVWIVTLATCIFSCFVFMFLENLNGERDGRSYKKWFSDNFYLSAINFTQNYTYEPTSFAGRIFGISFAFWTMLIGATYTANLASLLVEREIPPTRISDILEGIDRGYTMCTFENSFSDMHIKRKYAQAKRIPKATPEDMYDGVNNGECDILIGAQQSWLGFQTIESYNPNCDLEWVGRQVQPVVSAFATKVDPGVHCTGLINEVFNYYISEMKDNNFFDTEWGNYNEGKSTPNFNCNAGGKTEDDRRRQRQRRRRQRKLQDNSKQNHHRGEEDDDFKMEQLDPTSRNLKGGGGGGGAVASAAAGGNLKGGGGGGAAIASAAAGGGDGVDPEDESLTLNQMAGTFLLHCCGSILAIIVGLISHQAKEKQKYTFKGRNKGRNMPTADGGFGNETSSSDGQLQNHSNVQGQLDELRKNQAELHGQMSMVLKMLNHIQCQLDDGSNPGSMHGSGGGGGARSARSGVSRYESAKGSDAFDDKGKGTDISQGGGGVIGRVRSFFY